MTENIKLHPNQEKSLIDGLNTQLQNDEITCQEFLKLFKELEQSINDNGTQKEEINILLDDLEDEDIETVFRNAPKEFWLETIN